MAYVRSIQTVPSRIQVGDLVRHYGNTFRITEKSHSCHHGLLGDAYGPEKPTYYLKTELVEFVEGVMPRQWAETWVFQGNDYASFGVIQA